MSRLGGNITRTLSPTTARISVVSSGAVNRLFGGSTKELYLPYTDPGKLANDFGQFFVRKIENIRTELDNMDSFYPWEDTPMSRTFTGSSLSKTFVLNWITWTPSTLWKTHPCLVRSQEVHCLKHSY